MKRADELAATYGETFRPTAYLRDLASAGRVLPRLIEYVRLTACHRGRLSGGRPRHHLADSRVRRGELGDNRRVREGRTPHPSSTSEVCTSGSARWRRLPASTCRRTPGRRPRCWGATARASRPRCACWRGSFRRPPARCCVAGHDVRTETLRGQAGRRLLPRRRRAGAAGDPWEHLQLAARLRRLDQWEDRARDLLERFELGDVAHRVTAGFSHGMGRRLSVVLAALHEPDVLLLDEPFDGVDPIGVEATFDVISDARARGACVLRLDPPARARRRGLRLRQRAARRRGASRP